MSIFPGPSIWQAGTDAMESMISTAHLLMTKRVNLALRIVPGGNHSEASWERQIPIFMDRLGL